MMTYKVDDKTICVPGQLLFDHDDFASGRPIYCSESDACYLFVPSLMIT